MSYEQEYVRKDPIHGQRTRCIIRCQQFGFDQEERHSFAEMLVGHQGSWKTLSEPDAKRIAEALEAFAYIQIILQQRRVRQRERNDRPVAS